MGRHLAIIGAIGTGFFVLTMAILLLTVGQAAAADVRRDRLDIVKIALSVVAGVGGMVALVVAYRRQRVVEDAHRHTQTVEADKAHDALERRITDAYRHGVEQLGSDRAAVRLGGMYALERLAQQNPAHRQIVVDVLCAYLRMPYELTEALGADDAAAVTEIDSADSRSQARSAQEEREVRLTAQRILARHLRLATPGQTTDTSDSPWTDVDLDLTGAVLIAFDLEQCQLRSLRMSLVIFVDDATFRNVRVGDAATFRAATFQAAADFRGAAFAGDADFGTTTFGGQAAFDRSAFAGDAWFGGVTFASDTGFDDAVFSSAAGFHSAKFLGTTAFDGVTFRQVAGFHGATFQEIAGFDTARFGGDAWFDGVCFNQDAGFRRVCFSHTVGFRAAVFGGSAWFPGSRFDGNAWFDASTIARAAWFINSHFSRGAWFDDPSYVRARFDDATLDTAHTASPRQWPSGWGVTTHAATAGTAKLVRGGRRH
ncbi:pentapeptide repeat-containing protein [Cryptosporangium japonicum]|uniref:Pentapeptide repeat-containing protein n=1 Tax=Cryptosporangium japonicum TaxID=80872 RepID=A0ABN0V5H1_9ACTN